MLEHQTERPFQHKIISFIGYNQYSAGISSIINMLHLGKEAIQHRKSKSQRTEYDRNYNYFPTETTVESKERKVENDMITTLDTPLHLKTWLIRSIWMSNICVLVLDVSDGNLLKDLDDPVGFVSNQLRIVENIGPKHLIVCLTKCDLILESDLNSKLDEIRLKLIGVLNGWENVRFIPVSGYTGDNIYTPDYEYSKGETLNSILSSIKIDPPKKEWIEKPFLMEIVKIHKIGGIGIVVCGLVVSGKIEKGQQVFFHENKSNSLLFIEVAKGISKDQVVYGDICGIVFRLGTSNLSYNDVKDYGIIHDQSFMDIDKKAVESFRAQIKIYNSPSKYGIKVGAILKLYYSVSKHCPCKIEEIIYKIDSQTNEKVTNQPIILKEGDVAEVILKPQITTPNKRFYLDTFENNEIIGKIILMHGQNLAAAGKVLSIH